MLHRVDPADVMKLGVGMLRSEVFSRLGLPSSELNYGPLRKGIRALLGSRPELDSRLGYVDMGVVRAFPVLNLRSTIGVEIFFDETYWLQSIWCEPPFPGEHWSLQFGDSPAVVAKKRGRLPDEIHPIDSLRPIHYIYRSPRCTVPGGEVAGAIMFSTFALPHFALRCRG